MPTSMIRRLARAGLLLAGLASHAVAQDNAAHVTWLVEVLAVHPGSVVADIGAGDGQLTVPMAREVGPSGRIFATELPGRPLEQLRAAIEKADVKNVEIVEGHALRTNLPPECCDGIFIRYVYHHFADPPAVNASLRESLKPGGRLAIIEFAPDGPEASSPAGRAAGTTHGVTAQTIARELQQAGFEVAASEQRPDKSVLVAARKP
jgi:ubiquinone/menaquinone biosynthesis C-methylase UbiE